ncbi:hypothetical protein D3C84_495080 [compost metagenome]
MNWAIRKAAAPMTGGISWPPVDDAASTAAACSELIPDFFIAGMVNMPITAALAVALPLTEPNRVEETIDTFAIPPRNRPTNSTDRSMNNWPPPNSCRKAPNNRK